MPGGTIASGTVCFAVTSAPPSRETTSITSPAFSPSRGQRIFRSFPTSAGPIRSVISAVGRSLARRCKTTVPPLSGI